MGAWNGEHNCGATPKHCISFRKYVIILRMNTVLYFQSESKTSAPEKLAGVREIMEKRGHMVQVIEERPTARLVRDLWDFWDPLGAIIDCGGEYNNIDARIFSGRNVVFIGHNPDALPADCLLVSNDQVETARTAARELLSTGYENFAFVHAPERKKWSEMREREASRTRWR